MSKIDHKRVDASLADEMTDEARDKYVSSARLVSHVAQVLADELRARRDIAAITAVMFLSEIGEELCKQLTKHFAHTTGKLRAALKEENGGDDNATA
jgi:hypothetical protein